MAQAKPLEEGSPGGADMSGLVEAVEVVISTGQSATKQAGGALAQEEKKMFKNSSCFGPPHNHSPPHLSALLLLPSCSLRTLHRRASCRRPLALVAASPSQALLHQHSRHERAPSPRRSAAKTGGACAREGPGVRMVLLGSCSHGSWTVGRVCLDGNARTADTIRRSSREDAEPPPTTETPLSRSRSSPL